MTETALIRLDFISVCLLTLHITDLDTFLKIVASSTVIAINFYTIIKLKNKK